MNNLSLPRRALFIGNDFTRLNQDVKGNNFLFLSDIPLSHTCFVVKFYGDKNAQQEKLKIGKTRLGLITSRIT